MEMYVYGVVATAPVWSPSAEGVDGGRVELLEHGGLAALASEVVMVPVKANRRNLRAHSQVLQEVVAERCVLPMQFGVVMPDRDAVREELLGLHAERLHAQVDALEPYVELDVRVLCPEDAVLRRVVSERPEIADLRAGLAGRPAEATYYERIRLGELVAQAIAQERDAIAARVVERLETLAVATEAAEPLHQQMLANVAFLAPRDRLGEFDAAVEQLGRTLGADVRISYLGPLAPHRFVDLSAGSEVAAWA
jgi:gas vesicle protein GvpL/GvpF